MRISNYSFENLPFSQLFKTYVNDFSQLNDFYETDPFDEEAISQKISQFQFSGDRQKTADILTDFNRRFDVHQTAIDNLQRLKEKNALVVVTGQQLGIYGGPLYTALKIVSTIHLAHQLEQQFDQPVIPVFWLADEDHDYDEVRSFYLPNHQEAVKFALPPKSNHLSTVADMNLPDELQELRDELRKSLYDTDFSKELWELLDGSFKTEHTFLEAFGLLVSKLFSKYGLVLAGSNYPEVKKTTRNVLRQSITEADDIRSNLEAQSSQIGNFYHQQVTLYNSNLFYLDDEAGRTKIKSNGDGWATSSGMEWETNQIVREIEDQPSNFSPNVFLRPILQDTLLPTLGYVAGPGEMAYYGQMKDMYSCFDLDMPIIFPRLSATFVEPAIDRIFNELPFEFYEYSNRIEDLESDYVDRTEQNDIEAIFEDWKAKAEKLANPKKDIIAKIDPTLEDAAGKATTIYKNELDKLKGKVYRAVKKQDQTQLKRIRRIKANLFPNDNLQERSIASIFYMNKYGVDIWDKLLKSLDRNEQFDHHKLIYL